MKKLIAGVDFDGVIGDFLAQWEVAAYEVLGRYITLKEYNYDLAIRYGSTKAEKDLIWAHFEAAGHWAEIPAHPGAVSAVRQLISSGFDVHIITSIESHILPHRVVNMAAMGIPEIPVHAVNHVKIHKLRELKPMVYFDDNGIHIEEAKAAGVPYRYMIPNHQCDKVHPDATFSYPSLGLAVGHFLGQVLPPEGLAALVEGDKDNYRPVAIQS